jgi:putative endonuclease
VSSWYLYVLECERGVLYAGITTDVEKRFELHASGKGAAFTRINRPLRILGAAPYPDRAEATRAEMALKKASRDRKLRWARENAWPHRETLSP